MIHLPSTTKIKSDITTIEEMEHYLSDLQQEASSSLASALKAQLQVIKYVSSPTLVDSSLDLVFKNLKSAVHNAPSEDIKIEMLEKAHLMIHNYVFFMDARIQYSIENNRERGKALLQEASEELVKSAQELIIAAATQGRSIAIKQVSKSLVKRANDSGFFKKIIDWFYRSQKNKRELSNFLRSLSLLFKKLERHQDLIGKSDLIGGLIERWKEDVIDFETQHYSFLESVYFAKQINYKVIKSVLLLLFMSFMGVVALDFLSFTYPLSNGTYTYRLWHFYKDHYFWICAAMIIVPCLSVVYISYLRLKESLHRNRLEKKFQQLAESYYE